MPLGAWNDPWRKLGGINLKYLPSLNPLRDRQPWRVGLNKYSKVISTLLFYSGVVWWVMSMFKYVHMNFVTNLFAVDYISKYVISFNILVFVSTAIRTTEHHFISIKQRNIFCDIIYKKTYYLYHITVNLYIIGTPEIQFMYYIKTSLLNLFLSENSIANFENIKSNIQHYVYVLSKFTSYNTLPICSNNIKWNNILSKWLSRIVHRTIVTWILYTLRK